MLHEPVQTQEKAFGKFGEGERLRNSERVMIADSKDPEFENQRKGKNRCAPNSAAIARLPRESKRQGEYRDS
jgi:hypothetical protein